jgi:hypothetical protein
MDQGPEAVIDACIDWLGVAQDSSASRDGGVARDFSLITGWSTSYPETTGYIVPTILHRARTLGDKALLARAKRMLDWLVSIQFPNGAFQGGKIDAQPRVPVTFNTGQILLGLAAGVEAFGDVYREPMNRAAAWLRDTQDKDGCWRNYPTPFAAPGEKTYETHVSWGLFAADGIEPNRGYGAAGLRQLSWARSKQHANGWLSSCCLTDPEAPLTHTLGYALRGLLEGYKFSSHPEILAAARLTADGLMSALREDGYLPGQLDRSWRGAVSWACLTGSVQVAHCWLTLYQLTGHPSYRQAGYRANAYVRRTIVVDGERDSRGGVKGSFPVDGSYGAYQYLNWAAKFCIDSNLCEQEVKETDVR